MPQCPGLIQQRASLRGMDIRSDDGSHCRVRHISIFMPLQIAFERDQHPRRTKFTATMALSLHQT